MKNVMYVLAANWQLGYGILAFVCIVVYLVFSIRLIKECRRVGYDKGVSAMIPIWNLFIWIKKCIRSRRIKKQNRLYKENELIKL